MSKDLKKWCSDSIERSNTDSQVRIAIIQNESKKAGSETQDEPLVFSDLSTVECQALKDLRDSIQREIDLFCSIIV